MVAGFGTGKVVEWAEGTCAQRAQLAYQRAARLFLPDMYSSKICWISEGDLGQQSAAFVWY